MTEEQEIAETCVLCSFRFCQNRPLKRWNLRTKSSLLWKRSKRWIQRHWPHTDRSPDGGATARQNFGRSGAEFDYVQCLYIMETTFKTMEFEDEFFMAFEGLEQTNPTAVVWHRSEVGRRSAGGRTVADRNFFLLQFFLGFFFSFSCSSQQYYIYICLIVFFIKTLFTTGRIQALITTGLSNGFWRNLNNT